MNRLRAALAAGSLLAAGGAPATAQAGDSVPAERLAARRWFSDAKFGLFIHWGVYSQDGAGQRPPRPRRLEPLPRVHELAAHQAADAVRRRRRDLVRRHVGQAGRAVAAGFDLWVDPPPPARSARRS